MTREKLALEDYPLYAKPGEAPEVIAGRWHRFFPMGR